MAEATRVKASAPFSRKSRGTVFSIVGAMCMPTEHSILMFLGRVTADGCNREQNADRAIFLARVKASPIRPNSIYIKRNVYA
jgi:hypothetical protein